LRYLGKGPTPVLMEGSLFGMRSHEWLVKVLGQPDSSWFDLGGGEKRDDVMRLVLRETVDYLKKTQGPDLTKWGWGRQHQIKFSHNLGSVKPLDKLFNRGPYPLGGDGNTVWATGTSFFDMDAQVMVGPPFRFIADLGDLSRSLGLLAPGQSGLPASPHYADNIQAWFTGGYHRMLFSREDIDKEAKDVLRLEP
jgi:penicillin G amidase